MRKEIASCPSLQKTFGAVGGEESGDKAEMLIAGLGEGLVGCDCKLSIPNLRSVMFRILHNPNPTTAIVFDPAAALTQIALPATTTWADASKRFTADLKNAELVVAN